MMKRILSGAAAAGFAVSLLASSPVHADACNEGSKGSTDNVQADLPDGGTIYGEMNEAGDGGFVGIEGPHGYLEAGGDAASSDGYVEGENPESDVHGRLVVSDPSGICLSPATD